MMLELALPPTLRPPFRPRHRAALPPSLKWQQRRAKPSPWTKRRKASLTDRVQVAWPSGELTPKTIKSIFFVFTTGCVQLCFFLHLPFTMHFEKLGRFIAENFWSRVTKWISFIKKQLYRPKIISNPNELWTPSRNNYLRKIQCECILFQFESANTCHHFIFAAFILKIEIFFSAQNCLAHFKSYRSVRAWAFTK